jgi:TolB-like protein/DNA-binding winged helix-turn-helix (wHTH) protein/Tfp pilus assembly protein PilF
MDRTSASRIYEFADFRVDGAQRLLLSKGDGRILPLTSRAFETLLFFVEHPGELLDKATLMKAIWPNSVVEENNLNQSIMTLRRVLGESRDDHRFIVTVPGRGYRFVADVKTPGVAPVQPTTSGAEPPAPPLPASDGTVAPKAGSSVLSGGRIVTWSVAAAAILISGGSLLWFVARPVGSRMEVRPAVSSPIPTAQSSASSVTPVAARMRLAILPFENLSPDPANAFFSDGLHEEILSTLAQRVPGVDVISRTTMMSYRSKPKPLTEVARELGATHVIEGSVRREGNQVRLTLQLIDAGGDRHLWSQQYDRTLTSALTLQSQVAGEVASQLSVQLVPGADLAAPPTRDPQAYDLYLKALLALRTLNGDSPIEEFRNAEDLLAGALTRDPSFALAYAQRARTRTLKSLVNRDASEENLRLVREDLAAARRLAPNEPMVMAAEGYYLMAEGRAEEALSLIEAAEAAGLSDPAWLITKANLLLQLSRADEAVRISERSLSLDPASPLILSFAWLHLQLARRPAEALRVADLASGPMPVWAPFMRAVGVFYTTGDTSKWQAALDACPCKPDLTARIVDPNVIVDQFDLLRFEHRYPELLSVLDHVALASVPAADNVYFIVGAVGEQPVALYQGWTHLLLGDRAAASKDGRAVLNFVARNKETPRNRFYRRLLAAEGYTFTGERKRAAEAARASVELAPRAHNAITWLSVAAVAARVHAWSGGEDEAVTLLEELATATPGLAPGLFGPDPLYSVPLGHNQRFLALVARLESQIREIKLQ